MLEIGTLVDGKYKILNKVGQGGMSVVYLAMNEKANKQWAVKEVRKDGVKDFEVVKQGLVAETDILKKLNHPHLPSIIDVIDTDDSFIIIMDYIQGNSLNKALEEYGAQPQEHVIEWAKQLCDVLGYLHTRTPAIIYRDMKPANVMLKPDGNVTLIDFGTAREFKEKNLADTTCLGTVGYAAPEQFGGMGQTDARTDIYCLGATLYHLVTGMNPCEPPYEIKPIREINPALSGGLERIIQKCTQRDPNDRYQSAAELMYALEHYEEIDDIYRKKQKRRLGFFTATCALTLAFAVTSVWGYLSAEKKKSENYDVILGGISQVKEEDRVAEYQSAIAIDPSRTEAYLGTDDYQGLIDFLIDDGTLSAEEASVFSSFKIGFDVVNEDGSVTQVKNLETTILQNDEAAYKQICYQVGEAYLFYSGDANADNYKNASEWFYIVREDYALADVTCDIYDCLKNIKKFKETKQLGKENEELKKFWTMVQTLCDTAKSAEDDLKLSIWDETVRMIREYAVDFYGVTDGGEPVIELLDEIFDASREIKNTVFKDNITALQESIEVTKTKIQSVGIGDGQGEEA